MIDLRISSSILLSSLPLLTTTSLSPSSSDSADKVVQRTGKFEELVVASHDIAASTAQLVAASRVKARPKSEKLKSLKASSRNGVCVCVCVVRALHVHVLTCLPLLQCQRLQVK